jgi:uncharacterized protein (DUF433 family)
MSVVATHIEVRNNRSGQPRAYVGTSRTRVIDIYACSELRGASPAEIVESFPHLTLAQVHAALSYICDHREEIIRQLNEEEERGRRAREISGPGPVERKLSGQSGGQNAISS